MNGRVASAKAMKTVLTVIGAALTLSVCVGSTVASYYKGKMETQEQFAARDKAIMEIHEDILLKLKDIEAQLEWNEKTNKQLAKEISRSIMLHEAHMHPKEYASPSSPTKIEVEIDEPPESIIEGKKNVSKGIIRYKQMIQGL